MKPLDETIVRAVERIRVDAKFARLVALQQSGLDRDEGPFELATFELATFGHARATDWAPMPRVFCLDHRDEDRLDDVLAWYAERDRKPHFELLPFEGNGSLFERLGQLGFAPRYAMSVLLHDTYTEPYRASDVEVEPVETADVSAWCALYVDAHGWDYTGDERATWIAGLEVQYTAPGFALRWGLLDGRRVGISASFHTGGGEAYLTNSAVLPDCRGRGVHRAMIDHRVRELRAAGATHVGVDAKPYSTSQRNLERAGFRMAYQKTHWERSD